MIIFEKSILLLQSILLILIAPLLIGWINKIKCWCQQRSAPSVFLPYFSIRKLLIKEPILPESVSWIFQTAPYVYCASLILLCSAIPFFISQTLLGNSMNMIVLAGLLALARLFLNLGAMDAGTAFSNIGARRDLFVSSLSEPILLIIFYNMSMLGHAANLSDVVNYFANHTALFSSLIFSFLAFGLIAVAETGRLPIDNSATHLELTMIHEAMILEYSGRYLALIELGNALKLAIYLGMISALFFPFDMATHFCATAILLGLLVGFCKLFLLTTIIGCVESINSKLRIFKIPDYMASALMLAILGVLITPLL